MIVVLYNVNVAYPSSFIETFDSQRNARESAGELASSACAEMETPNNILVISRWESFDAANRFWNSPDCKALISEWDSVKEPIFEYFQCLD